MCGKIFRKFMVVRPHGRELKEGELTTVDEGEDSGNLARI
jgi:hypothetical protein